MRVAQMMQSGSLARIKDLPSLITPAGFLFSSTLLFFLWGASRGWSKPLLDLHAFRQTQTAISAYYMVGRPPVLAYDTPVLGPPWSIPFEFPLYQWLTAAVVSALDTPLDQTGRFVSIVLFLLTLIPANRVLAACNYSGQIRFAMLSMSLACPFYIHWSRAFMIESTALLLSMAYLAAVVSMMRQGLGVWSGTAAVVFGVLAALVKVTTIVPFSVAVLFLLGGSLSHRFKLRRDSTWAIGVHSVVLILICGLPLAALLWWTHFADAHKELNLVGRFLTSRQIADWNFGSFDQRCAPETWRTIFQRQEAVFGTTWVVMASVLGMCVARRRWLEYAICMVLYLIPPMVFTNLHYIHDYYGFANNIFLVAAVGTCLAALAERGAWCKYAALAGLLLIVACQVRFYLQTYEAWQSVGARIHIAEKISKAVQGSTGPDDVIIILGCDWSSEVPYYCRRRASMVPAWFPVSVRASSYLKQLKGYQVGALIVRRASDNHVDQSMVEEFLAETGFRLKAEIRGQSDVYKLYARSTYRGVGHVNQ